jgi:hypothetical protein
MEKHQDAQGHLPARGGSAGWRQGLGSLRHTTADKHDVGQGVARSVEEFSMRRRSITSSVGAWWSMVPPCGCAMSGARVSAAPHSGTILLLRQRHRRCDTGLRAMYRSGVALPRGVFD